MSQFESFDKTVSASDFEDVIGGDYRRIKEKSIYPYDLNFFQNACDGHEGFVLHPFASPDARNTLRQVDTVIDLVRDDEAQEINDHDLGTLSDDYSDTSALVQSVVHPHLLISDVNRFVICGALSGIIGRLDEQPVYSEDESPESDIAMWIADPFRQRNIASYVLNRFTRDSFIQRPYLQRFRAQVLVGNIAARKLVEQGGFTKSGIIFQDDLEPFQMYVLERPEEI
jgi:RimJ/RimL family protein N-acetyltransferase